MTLTDRLNDLALFAMLTVLAAILSYAMVLQYTDNEIPCPLCLLQRVAMFGVCFGIVLHFRHGPTARNTGMSMLFTLLLLIISVRQTLLDIVPRAGHDYVGSAVLGLHMPVWSVLIATALLAAFALKLAVLGGDRRHLPQALQPRALPSEPQALPSRSQAWPIMARLAGGLSLYVVALCVINLVSVILQCGLGECHTTGYKLLS